MKPAIHNPYADWAMLSVEAWMLGLEASTVIARRLHGFAWASPGAEREATQMVSEKLQSLAELQWDWMTGAMGSTPFSASQRTIRHYRRKVGANHRRLTR